MPAIPLMGCREGEAKGVWEAREVGVPPLLVWERAEW